MTTLRARKKREIKEQIIKSAERIFLQQGYEKTTIAQIAQQADIGIGTFYNYFSSKAEIFLFTFIQQTHKELSSNFSDFLLHSSDDPERILNNLLNLYFDTLQKIDKAMWKELLTVLMSNPQQTMKNLEYYLEIDMESVDQLTTCFSICKDKGILPPGFNIRDGAECVFGIFMTQTLMYYLYERIPTFEIMKENILRQVKYFIIDRFIA